MVTTADADLGGYLSAVRTEVLGTLRALLPPDTAHTGGLYGLMLDYPLRPAKTLRPAIAMAACRALGGQLDAVLPSAAALELLHNAFLVHDDIEDGSELRRGAPTLHQAHGLPIAVNVGDGMLAMALRPLLDNTRLIGLARSMDVLEIFVETARESAEGQALELAWIRENDWSVRDVDYLRMVYKKTARYSFVAPCSIGAVVAGATVAEREGLERFAALLGIAFQIQDDCLNLTASESAYGKEIGGDLWEGKHTLILLHALRRATPAERARACDVLGCARVDERFGKTEGEVAFLADLVARTGAVASARDVAHAHAARARRSLVRALGARPRGPHHAFLMGLVDYVVHRDR